MSRSQPSNCIEVYLGDYIDRGPASRDVLGRLIGRSQIRRTVCLKGNHEEFAVEFMRSPEVLGNWQHCGGLETLMSYGLRPPMNADLEEQTNLMNAFKAALPHNHVDFLARLHVFFSCGDFFFVHAGVRPRVPLDQQREQDMLWIREEFLSHEADFGKMVVHGHTPVLAPEFRPNRINIDTGAFATGVLTCLRIENNRMEILD